MNGKWDILKRIRENHCVYLLPVILFKRYIFYPILLSHYRCSDANGLRWHYLPKEAKPYSMDIVKILMALVKPEDLVVEIGCGLGEILACAPARHRFGFDLNKHILDAGRYLHRSQNLSLAEGTFADVEKRGIRDMDFLLCLQFLHLIPTEEVKRLLQDFFSKHPVRFLFIDTVPVENAFAHDWSQILPSSWICIWKKEYEPPLEVTNYLFINKDFEKERTV